MMSVDAQSLAGWDIRLFAANLVPTEELKSHKAPLHHQVAMAVFPSGHGLEFSFAQMSEDLSSSVTFDVREVINAVPRPGKYDNSAMPPIGRIPLSRKNSLLSLSVRRTGSGSGRRRRFLLFLQYRRNTLLMLSTLLSMLRFVYHRRRGPITILLTSSIPIQLPLPPSTPSFRILP
jgi:hypothetical protein